MLERNERVKGRFVCRPESCGDSKYSNGWGWQSDVSQWMNKRANEKLDCWTWSASERFVLRFGIKLSQWGGAGKQADIASLPSPFVKLHLFPVCTSVCRSDRNHLRLHFSRFFSNFLPSRASPIKAALRCTISPLKLAHLCLDSSCNKHSVSILRYVRWRVNFLVVRRG